jgi:predicted pyridoxine 5'-phosphate oxidase superfamily flavin-nucleotide-binding protein
MSSGEIVPHFNPDELAAQRLAGGGPRSDGIQDHLADHQRHFLAHLPYVFIGAIDADGWPLATLLTGAPGFLRSPDSVTLDIAALPAPGDPAATALVFDRQIGILAIDLATRRRSRINGRIIDRSAGGIRVAVDQSFGNCPQYIQRRSVMPPAPGPAGNGPRAAETFSHLDDEARTVIASADTFFVASRSRSGDDMTHGADISHRGGRPGFVRIDADRGGGDVLTIPDFRGNRYFNTLGNLMADPRASLLFVDFDSGDLLQLQGTAQVEWNSAEAAEITGAERLWRFHLARGWRRRAASPLRWSFIDYSPTTIHTGSWRRRVLPPAGPGELGSSR